MRFRVSRQYQRGSESFFAEFTDRNEAEFFIHAKLEADRLVKLNVTYHLYEGTFLLDSFHATDAGSSVGGAGAGAGSGSTFQPTPFNMAPRPAGMPQNWVQDDKKSDDSKGK